MSRDEQTAANRQESAEILDACCGGRHWWWDKSHPLALYMDHRTASAGSYDHRPNWSCKPDIVADFRDMPFDDDSFQLVLFDPPHILRPNPSGRTVMAYGALTPESEQDDLRRGFMECWRVLRPGGTLVFKWADKLSRVQPHFPATPIIGTRSPRGGQTRWFIFYKPRGALREAATELGDLREAIARVAQFQPDPLGFWDDLDAQLVAVRRSDG